MQKIFACCTEEEFLVCHACFCARYYSAKLTKKTSLHHKYRSYTCKLEAELGYSATGEMAMETTVKPVNMEDFYKSEVNALQFAR